MTTFLRFPDEARAIACMGAWYVPPEIAGLAYGWAAPQSGWSVDVIGPIDGQGFHLNVIGDVPAKARPFAVEPATPFRVFAS